MNVDIKIKSLIFLFIAYLSVLIISYSTFLQIPVFDDEVIVWQSLLEQFITWIPIALAYFYVLNSILKLEKVKKTFFEEKKLLIPGMFLIFISAFSAGIHAIAQIAEEFLANAVNTNFYRTMFFFDEYIGHLFFITLTVAVFLVIQLELNRKPKKITKADKIIIWTIGSANGLFWGIGGIEGGSMYLPTIPIAVFLVWRLLKTLKENNLKIDNYALTKYYLISTATMIAVSIFWILFFGWFSQPAAAGFHLFTF